ncbi:MAG: hypothetical protein ACO390_14440 [bacterium]
MHIAGARSGNQARYRQLAARYRRTSQGNTTIHRKFEKRDLYFESGALECRVSDAAGKMRFFHASGESERSKLVPQFPKQITPKPGR